MKYLKKLKIKAQNRTMIGLSNHYGLLVGEVLTERSEGKARSGSKSNLSYRFAPIVLRQSFSFLFFKI